LLGVDQKQYQSLSPGTLGGRRSIKKKSRLTCRSAIQAIRRGGYVKYRVFFLDEASAKG